MRISIFRKSRERQILEELRRKRSELKKIPLQDPPPEVYNFQCNDISAPVLIGRSNSLSTVPTSAKRDADNEDDASQKLLKENRLRNLDQTLGPPSVLNVSFALGDNANATSINGNQQESSIHAQRSSPKRKSCEDHGNLPGPHTPKRQELGGPDLTDEPPRTEDDASPEALRRLYLERHATMKAANKFRLGPDLYLEDVIAQQFQDDKYQMELKRRCIGSNIIDWEVDGPWLQMILEERKIDIDEVRRRTKPAPLPELPQHQKAWLDNLWVEDCVKDKSELQTKIHNLNRPDPMPEWERIMSEWASGLLNRWRFLCQTGQLADKRCSEQHYATMIMASLIDHLLDHVQDMRLLRYVSKDRPRGSYVDLKMVGPHQCEYFVMDSAPRTSQSSSGSEYDTDKGKTLRHLHDEFWLAETRTKLDLQHESSGFQFLGALTAGLDLTVFGMTHVGYMSFLSQHDQVSIPDAPRNMRGLLDAMELVMKIFNLLGKQVNLAFKAGARRTKSFEANVLPCMPTPKKVTKKVTKIDCEKDLKED
ncbi:MAG: hypothetical protein Q9219_004793 [cf. Caloplaca sp. 3 TL-2023]